MGSQFGISQGFTEPTETGTDEPDALNASAVDVALTLNVRRPNALPKNVGKSVRRVVIVMRGFSGDLKLQVMEVTGAFPSIGF